MSIVLSMLSFAWPVPFSILRNVPMLLTNVFFVTVTHLVTSVENGCCARTLKYLYAVAAAKWIVSFNCKYLYLSVCSVCFTIV